MESPVRIKILGYIVFFICFLSIDLCCCYPNDSINTKVSQDDSFVESTTENIQNQTKNETVFKYQPRNHTLFYQRRSGSTLMNSNVRSSTLSPIETTINYGNKITFRGSVKYFATRPPFKPKTPYIRKTHVEKDEDKLKAPISKLDGKTQYRRRNTTHAKYSSLESSTIAASNEEVTTAKEYTTQALKNTNRTDSAKSFNFNYNVNRYTSPEFHDINNVYNQPISPTNFVVPENVSDYFVSVGSAPYTKKQVYINLEKDEDLTTPRTELFDKHFREISESIKQNLADIEFSNEEHELFDDNSKQTSDTDFDTILSKVNDSSASVSFKNTKELLLTDLENSQSVHKEELDSNGTKIFYEISSVSTEIYDPKFTTEKPTKKNIELQDREITTISALSSNEVINSSTRRNSNISRRTDRIRNNDTRKDFFSTIRMRTPTTPRPRVHISLKNNSSESEISLKEISTIRTTNFLKNSAFSRRRPFFNNTGTTVPSKIDPVYQSDYSSTRLLDYKKSEEDNSIPTLNKRGSLKYYEKSDNNTEIENNDNITQFSLPPTATAWALISLKDTPIGNKNKNVSFNSSNITSHQPDIQIKTEDDLQTLDKTTGFSSEPSLDKKTYEKIPTISTIATQVNETATEDSEELELYEDEVTSGTKTDYGTIFKTEESRNDDIFSIEESSTANSANINGEISTLKTNTIKTDITPLFDIDSRSSTYKSKSKSKDSNTNTFFTIQEDVEFKEITEIPPITIGPNLEFEEVELSTFETTYNTKKEKSKYNVPIIVSTTIPKKIIEESYITTTETTTASSTDDFLKTEEENTKSTEEASILNILSTTTSKMFLTTESQNEDYISKMYDVSTQNYNFEENDNGNISLMDKKFSTIDSDESDISTTETLLTLENLNHSYFTTNVKNANHDIETAFTTHYSSTAGKLDIHSTSFTTDTPIKKSTTFNSEENIDSREAKKSSGVDDDEKTNAPTESFDNIDDWTDSPDPSTSIRNMIENSEVSDSKINYTTSLYSDNELHDFKTFDDVTNKPNNVETTSLHDSNPNIEIITPSLGEEHFEENYSYDSTSSNSDSTGLENVVDGSGAIAAITISVIGVIALILLIGLLIIARGRRRSGGYGQRCTPVSLDSYSLDNVSVSGSTRRKGRGPSKRSYGNPAYDESGATSHPMQFAALTNFALDQDSIMNEFNDIPTITARADEVPQGCESKNRYSNVVPLPETRVVLKSISGDPTSDYINANYIRGPKSMKNYYIACQAPLGSTVNDFWRMIWEQNSRVILMLTELMENGVEKCFEYIPSSEVSDNKRIFGDFQVTLNKREVRDKYAISILQLKSLSSNNWREITHMWYFWPAKGVPDECHSIIAFLIEARSYLKASQNAKDFDENGHELMTNQNGNNMIEQDDSSNGENNVNVYNVQKVEQKVKNGAAKNGMYVEHTEGKKKGGPLVVHCSPGTGRTGALIACDIGIRDFEMSRTVDVPKTVYRIRRDRANAVQTKDQYIFIYKVLSEYATKLTGGILDSI